jgi:Amt family ammonium transporter
MKLRMPDDVLEVGDVAAHDEEAYPDETLVTAGSGARTALPDAVAAAAEPEP